MQLGPTLCSVVKPENIWVKVDTDNVRLFNAEHHQVNPPEKWVHSNVEVRLEVRGVWRTATNSGISVCCTDIRFAAITCRRSCKRAHGHLLQSPTAQKDGGGRGREEEVIQRTKR